MLIKNIFILFLCIYTTFIIHAASHYTMETLPSTIKTTIATWQQFLNNTTWQELILGRTPLLSGCGIVYELPNFLNRPQEDFAIVDMRTIDIAEPHYHPGEDIEIYFVLQGTALVVVGGIEYHVSPGDIVVIPPQTAHFTLPDHNYIIAVVNNPPFSPERYIKLTESNEAVRFCSKQLKTLLKKRIFK